jgi:hypothetical protein
MQPPDDSRHKIVQALSPILLEAAILRMEAEGWRRVGSIALATPQTETKPPYWAAEHVAQFRAPDGAQPAAGLTTNAAGSRRAQWPASRSPGFSSGAKSALLLPFM